ncbi:MAG: hypothetical protein K8S56_10425, partial [Candidatus Cloacimonetes bacterium]|nr:hypothetical protein [Candidatus Cloacimonadota bacterium]
MRLNIILIFLTLTLSLSGVTHTVRQDGQGDFTVIQNAIIASTDGDTVLVHPGRYFENIEMTGRNITLASLEITTGNYDYVYNTIIDGNQTGSCIALWDPCNAVTIQGFTLTNGSGNSYYGSNVTTGGGIYCHINVDVLYLTNLLVTGNRNSSSVGGVCLYSNLTYLSGVSIHDNETAGIAGGLHTEFDNMLIFDPINRCSIYNNYSGWGQDIYYMDAQLTCNVILDTFSVIQDDNYFAIGIPSGSLTVPCFTFDIQHSYYNQVEANLYVAPWGNDQNSGLTPYEPLQRVAYALHLISADSTNHRTVSCAPGIYSNSGNQQYFPACTKSYVTLEGSSEAPTVFDNEMNPRPFVYTPAYGKHITIRNFEWRNLNTITTLGPSYNSHLISGTPILFENIKLENCTSMYAAGLTVLSSENVTFRNITMNNMTAFQQLSGIFISHSDNILVENCSFNDMVSLNYDNQGWRNAFSAEHCEGVTLRNSSFRNCSTSYYDGASAIFMAPMNGTTVTDYLVENVLVADCYSPNARSALTIHGTNGGSAVIANCTFINNENRVATLFTLGNVTVRNSIFRNNSPNEFLMQAVSNHPITILDIDYCNIAGGQASIQNQDPSHYSTIWGTHNIEVDPQFVGSGQYTYTLQPGSSCIDAGDTATTMPWYIVYNERVWDGDNDGTAVADIGAYEYQPIFPA